MGKAKTIPSGERSLILNVIKFFEDEKRNGRCIIPISQVDNRVSAATGVSRSTVSRIKREEAQIMANLKATGEPLPPDFTITLPTPGKVRKRKKTAFQIDDSMLNGIQSIINSYYMVYKEEPTLKKVLEAAKRDLNFPGQKETLRKILITKLGLRFKNGKKGESFIETQGKMKTVKKKDKKSDTIFDLQMQSI